jgi:hypothetical protein
MSAAWPLLSPEAIELAELYDLRTVGEYASYIHAQREADQRAERCRELCLELWVRQELLQALVHRAASEAVVRAAARRFRDWRDSLEPMRYELLRRGRRPAQPPSYEDAAAEIVDQCMRLERVGLLERVAEGK